MVYCCFVEGCHSRSDLDRKTHSFHAIPAVIRNQGEQTYALSLARRRAWITAINKPNAEINKYSKICSEHFLSGKPASLRSCW